VNGLSNSYNTFGGSAPPRRLNNTLALWADVRGGEQIVKDVYESVRAGPGWNKTMLVITYDDAGGFFVRGIVSYATMLPCLSLCSAWRSPPRGKSNGILCDGAAVSPECC
jgi:hypothetical protein